MKSSPVDRLPVLAYSTTVLLAGMNAIAVRYTVLELSTFWGAAIRFIPAAIIMFGLVLIMRLPLPKGREFTGILIFGALNFGIGYAFLYLGLENVQPGMVMVILALGPLFTLIFAVAHRLETFRWRALFGAFLALAGTALVFREQLRENVPLVSLLFVVLGGAAFAEATVIMKGYPKSHPVTTNAISMLVGGLILLIMSFITNETKVIPVQQNTWLALIYLIVLGSCTVFFLALYTLKRMPPSTFSYQFVLMPFVTLTASALITGEQLSPLLLAGAALVLTGVFIGGIYSPHRRMSMESQPVKGD